MTWLHTHAAQISEALRLTAQTSVISRYGGFGVDAPPPPPMQPGIPSMSPPHQPAAAMAHPGGGLAPQAPHPAEVARVWHEHHARLQHDHVMHQHRMSRELLLDPNKFSSLKVERYSFTLPSPVLAFGTPGIIDATLQPAVKMRPDRLVANVSTPFFVELTTIQVSNVNILVGGAEDAYIYNPQGQNIVLQLPTIEPAFRVTMTGDYSGQTPASYLVDSFFTFRLSFQGWAVLAGNG